MAKIIIGGILIAWGIGALLNISIMKFVFALILIVIGLKVILGKEGTHFSNFGSSRSTSNENFINEVNVFSSANKVIKSEDFKGGKITMIFSGGKIDLSQVKTSKNEIEMEVVAMFGGAQLIVPRGWKVNSQGTSIFGGYDTKIEGDGHEVTLNLKGVAIFGGVKITN
jgi:predicted membrane protein